MPLFPPPNQSLETSTYTFIANGVQIAQTVFLNIVETPTYSMVISTMECFINAVNASNPTIELGIYAWNTSGNGVLLSSGTVIPTSGGFWTVTLATPVLLNPRSKYYFAYLNRTAADVTTSLGVIGANTNTTQVCATMASQTVMPANLASLVTTNANRLVLRGWT